MVLGVLLYHVSWFNYAVLRSLRCKNDTKQVIITENLVLHCKENLKEMCKKKKKNYGVVHQTYQLWCNQWRQYWKNSTCVENKNTTHSAPHRIWDKINSCSNFWRIPSWQLNDTLSVIDQHQQNRIQTYFGGSFLETDPGPIAMVSRVELFIHKPC